MKLCLTNTCFIFFQLEVNMEAVVMKRGKQTRKVMPREVTTAIQKGKFISSLQFKLF